MTRCAAVRLLTGGAVPEGRGWFYPPPCWPPTVLADVPEGAAMLGEEIFGSVAALQRFRDENEAIRRANATEHGLMAYLYTRDQWRGLWVAEQFEFLPPRSAA